MSLTKVYSIGKGGIIISYLYISEYSFLLIKLMPLAGEGL